MIKVADLPLEQDIGPFCLYLRQRGVDLRVVESSGRQALYVNNEALAEEVREALARYFDEPQLQQELQRIAGQGAERRGPGRLQLIWRHLPTVSLLLLSLAFTALITGFGAGALSDHFLITQRYIPDFFSLGQRWGILQAQLGTLEGWWRLLAPAWVHWGAMHWVFNSLALWIFGPALEKQLGAARLLMLVLLSAVISNIAQFMISGPLFGGFSGVVYALVGAQMLGMRLHPGATQWAPPAMLGLALLSLLVGLSGVLELAGLALANTAHLSGFVCGVALYAFLGRR